jgi:hypothetical protein
MGLKEMGSNLKDLRFIVFFAVLLTGCSALAQGIALNNLPGDTAPFVVNAGYQLYKLNEVRGDTETFEFEGVLVLNWQDDRQAFDPDDLGVEERVFSGNFEFTELFDGWWPQLILTNSEGQRSRQGIILRIQPDGTVWYIEEFEAIAESAMDFTRFPFDEQLLQARFEILGYSADEVQFKTDGSLSGITMQGMENLGNATWDVDGLRVQTAMEERIAVFPPGVTRASVLTIEIDAERQPGYFLRSVVAPLMLFIILSWSVFWMDRESLGDRINVSFIGLLTVVAFQIIVDSDLPAIPYFTLMSGFLASNYLLLAATVVINLRVGYLDRSGRGLEGDTVDRACRWLFPLIYFGILPLVLLIGSS